MNTFLAVMVLVAATEPQRKLLANHETVAIFSGVKYDKCQGKTSICPKCSLSGNYANFTIMKYLKYEKFDKYGSDQQETSRIQVSDFNKKPKGDEKLLKIIAGLTKGDFVLLSWHHNYGSNGKVIGPEYPIINLEPIDLKKAKADEVEQKAIRGIEKSGGSFVCFFLKTGKIPLALNFPEKKATDMELKELVCLKHLFSLDMSGTPVTDAGLKNLVGLTCLRSLELRETKVTDTGLKILAELPQLRCLGLNSTQVTDEGLKKLTGLKELFWLSLHGTKVTDAGVTEFQKKHPKCKVSR